MFLKKQLAALLDGVMTDHSTSAEGVYRGYRVNLFANAGGSYQMTVSAYSDDDPGNARLLAYLNNRKLNWKQIRAVSAEPYCFHCSITASTAKQGVRVINEFTEDVVRWMTGFGYQSGCSSCGRTDVVRNYLVNNSSVCLCPDCINSLQNTLEAGKQNKKAERSNLITGIVGAFLGALIGGILYIFLSQLGYVAGITGVVMSVLALRFYEKLGGALDVKGVLVTMAVLIVMVWFSNKLSWGISIWQELKDYDWSFGDCFRDMSWILEESELTGNYLSNLAMGYLFTFLGAIGSFINALKGSTGSYSIKEL